MIKKYNNDLALIGAGYWGKNLARVFNQLGVLNTICDTNDSILEKNSSLYPNLNIETDYNKVLNNPKIKRIAISAPAEYHYRLARKALESNKDVFVEKPLCLKVHDCEDLIELAKKKGNILMVGHLLQYHPCIEAINNIIKDGSIGQLFYISSSRLNLGKIRTEENALWSFAPHDISVMLGLVGNKMPLSLSCTGGDYITPGIVDTTMTTMNFSDGVRAHIHVSWLNPFKEQKLTVIGSESMIVFDDTKPIEEKLTLYPNYLKRNSKSPAVYKYDGDVIKVSAAEPLLLECEHFIDCCNKRIEPKTNGFEGLQVLKVLDFAQISLNNNGNRIDL